MSELHQSGIPVRIQNWGLSPRAFNALQRTLWKTFGNEFGGTIYEVLNLTFEDLRKAPNCGRKSLKEIIDFLAQYGLRLKDELSEEERSKKKDARLRALWKMATKFWKTGKDAEGRVVFYTESDGPP